MIFIHTYLSLLFMYMYERLPLIALKNQWARVDNSYPINFFAVNESIFIGSP